MAARLQHRGRWRSAPPYQARPHPRGAGGRLARAKKRLGWPEETSGYRCDEAGREGFWLHRSLSAPGVHNLAVAAASIEGKRRGRRTQPDRRDASKLLPMRIRHCTGEQKVWRVVQVPRGGDEDRRHVPRALEAMQAERTLPSNRRQGRLAR
jgi:transposase